MTDIFKNTPTSHIGDDNQLHFEVYISMLIIVLVWFTITMNQREERTTMTQIYFHIQRQLLLEENGTFWSIVELKPLLKKYNIDINLEDA